VSAKICDEGYMKQLLVRLCGREAETLRRVK